MKQQKKQILWLVGVFAFVILIAGAYMLYEKLGDQYQPDNLVENASKADVSNGEEDSSQKAPDFVVTDREGNTVMLSDFFGKPIVLNFWASWCGPCKQEMPGFQNMYEKYGDEVEFLMVNLTQGRETMKTATAFLDGAGYRFPVYFDQEGIAGYVYGASSIPLTYLIDRDGYLIARAPGSLSEEKLEQGIQILLKES